MCGSILKGVFEIEFTGKLKDVNVDWVSGQYNITFTINEQSAVREIENIKDADKLSIKAVKFRQKRSLDSNAYAWVMMQKIAEAVHSDKWSIYLEMLKKYSREFTFVICKEQAIDKLKDLYRTCVDLGEVNVNGTEGHQMQVFFGSSTFDTKSMSIFIDGIVSECKELGIETLPPAEIERMNAAWNNGKQ
jgi:hypothetical protein